MVEVRVIDDGGNERLIEFSESTFGVDIDGVIHRPAATQSIEVESNGNTERTGTQCGDMKQRTTSTDPFKVTVECIITFDNETNGPRVLTVRDVLYEIREGDSVTIDSKFPIEQAMTVSNVLVTQDSELVSVNTRYTDGEAKAARCQLQFGAEETA